MNNTIDDDEVESPRKRTLRALHVALQELANDPKVDQKQFFEIAGEISQITSTTRVWDWTQWLFLEPIGLDPEYRRTGQSTWLSSAK